MRNRNGGVILTTLIVLSGFPLSAQSVEEPNPRGNVQQVSEPQPTEEAFVSLENSLERFAAIRSADMRIRAELRRVCDVAMRPTGTPAVADAESSLATAATLVSEREERSKRLDEAVAQARDVVRKLQADPPVRAEIATQCRDKVFALLDVQAIEDATTTRLLIERTLRVLTMLESIQTSLLTDQLNARLRALSH